MRPASQNGSVWSIVLAGGEGTRMCPLIQRWLGKPRPKQYCCFYGTRTLLSCTLDRFRKLMDPGRIVTVIGRGHRSFLDSEAPPGPVIEQPWSRGTGPGVFLPAAYILAGDPEAVVVVSPSDHFVSPEDAFVRRVREAIDLIHREPERIVLIGACPAGPEPEYGWIEPDKEGAVCPAQLGPAGFRQVKSFREKPSVFEAKHCFSCGHYWNTMIVVARLQALWTEARRVRPRTMRRFETLLRLLELIRGGYLPEESAQQALAGLYENLEPFDFSRDLLTAAAGRCLILPLVDVIWSDLGRPERLIEMLAEMGYSANFPQEVAEEFRPSSSIAASL
ncbi:MAG: sugar phosphate nucleotidyltransferase [Acidobacteriota bacterium]